MNLVHGYSAGKARCCTSTWETLREKAGERGKKPGDRSFHRVARQELARPGSRLRRTYLPAGDTSLDGIACKRRRKVLRVLTEAEVREERRREKIARRLAREAQSRAERARARELATANERQERKPSAPSMLGNVLAELATPRPALRLVVDNVARPRTPPARAPRAPSSAPPPERPATREEIAEFMRKLREDLGDDE